MPSLSWQTIVLGDPLCRPFPRRALTRADIEDHIEAKAEIPVLFRNRRLEALRPSFKGVPQEALDAWLIADVRQAYDDLDGVRVALEQMTALAPNAIPAHFRLATQYGRLREYRKAVERYRIVIEAQPRNALALNNLAYALGIHLRNPEEALPFARRAVAAEPESGGMLDTLGWMEYLTGNTAAAAKLLADASRRIPESAEVRLHAAIALAAVGSWADSATNLKEAVRLDPSLAKREDVVNLQRNLSERRK